MERMGATLERGIELGLLEQLSQQADLGRNRFRHYLVRDAPYTLDDMESVVYHQASLSAPGSNRYNLNVILEGTADEHNRFATKMKAKGEPIKDLIWNFFVEHVGTTKDEVQTNMDEFNRYVNAYMGSFNQFIPLSLEPFDEAFLKETLSRYNRPGMRREGLAWYQIRALPQHMHIRDQIRAVVRNTTRNIVGDYMRATLDSGEVTAAMRAGRPTRFAYGIEHRLLAKAIVSDLQVA